MKIIFHPNFYDTTYASDGASVPGRLETIMKTLINEEHYEVIEPKPATFEDIATTHDVEYIKSKSNNKKLYEMALLSAGGAILASEYAMKAEATFACIRPPGHHAHYDSGWGYCHFCNMAIAITKLIKSEKIKSAFILDFDAHTGDGTIDLLSSYKSVKILNPMAENSNEYMSLLENYLKELQPVDIIGVCAGFDSYEKDVGRKLTTFNFYQIGYMISKLAKKFGHNRKFAILEGGYYLPDLGKNVLAFCQGFSK